MKTVPTTRTTYRGRIGKFLVELVARSHCRVMQPKHLDCQSCGPGLHRAPTSKQPTKQIETMSGASAEQIKLVKRKLLHGASQVLNGTP